MLSIGSVVMNVRDLRRALEFWMQALGYLPKREIKADDDFVILVPGRGHGAQLSLNLSATPAPHQPHVHLDLYAGDAADQAAEVERLIALGARRVEWDYPAGADYIVLADPEGNRFCVIDTSHG